jgi:alkane 1-monooxygenase
LTIPLSGYIAFTNEGLFAWLGVLYAFVILPILDQLLPTNSNNNDSKTIKKIEENIFYDIILITLIPGMIVLSLFCPLFIAIMNHKLDTLPHIVNKV